MGSAAGPGARACRCDSRVGLARISRSLRAAVAASVAPPCPLLARSLPLASSVGLGDPAAKLIITAQVDVIKIKPVEEPLLLNLAGKVFNLSLNVPLAHVGRTDQRTQRGLVLDLALSRLAPPAPAALALGIQLIRADAPRPSPSPIPSNAMVALPSASVAVVRAWLPAGSRPTFPPSPWPGWRAGGAAGLPETHFPDLVQQPLVLLVSPSLVRGPLARRDLGQHLVAGLVLGGHVSLVRVGAALFRMRRDKHVEQCHDCGVVPRVSHMRAA